MKNLILLTLLTLLSCNNDHITTDTLDGKKYTVTTEKYTFYADPQKYLDANKNWTQPDQCKFSWKVKHVGRSGNTIRIDISKPKHCEVSYDILWNGAIMESYPPMANIFLIAKSENCTDAGEMETEQLIINLEEAFKDVPTASLRETVFYIKQVCSSTSIECKKDCDVSLNN